MPEVHVARNFPSAGAGSDHQRVLLCARDTPAPVSGIRYAVLAYQPFCRRWIHQCRVDLAAMLLAELFKRPIGDKRVNDP